MHVYRGFAIMDQSTNDVEDKRVITLAAEIAETSDKNVPGLLLELQVILESASPGSRELGRIKHSVWQYELLQVLVVSLKQDFSHISGGWNTAAKLANLLSKCCLGLDPVESNNEYYGVTLPNALENMLLLARRVQAKYIKTPTVSEMTKEDLLKDYKAVINAISYLFSGHLELTVNALRSPWLLQLLITDDTETAVSAMGLVQSVSRVNREVYRSLDEKVLHQILDEVVYKLSASNDEHIGSSATRCLLVMCEAYSPMVDLICNRYRGLRPLLTKWTGRGFGRDLREFLMLLDAGSAQKVEAERLYRAATTIQAVWRRFLTKKRLKNADKAMASFQQKYRKTKVLKEQKRSEEKEQKDLQLVLLRKHRDAMRQFQQKRIEILGILQPSEVDKYLEGESKQAAILIQKTWRGYRERRKMAQRRDKHRTVKAATRIQRAVRRWLARVYALKHEPPPWQRPPGLSDERRVQLQEIIMAHRENHQVVHKGKAQQEELHEQVQESLRRHFMLSNVTRKQQQRREALLARLQTDADLILDAPKLSEATEKDVETFTSRSVPVATLAKKSHSQELRLLRQPWWRKLGDEYQDQQYEEERPLF